MAQDRRIDDGMQDWHRIGPGLFQDWDSQIGPGFALHWLDALDWQRIGTRLVPKLCEMSVRVDPRLARIGIGLTDW